MQPDTNSTPQQPQQGGYPPQPQQPYPQGPYPQNYDNTPQLPQPQDPSSYPPAGGGGGGKKVLLAVVAIVVLLAIGIGAYFAMNSKDKVDNKKTDTAIKESQDQATQASMEDLSNVTLIPPSDLTSYTPNERNTAQAMSYATADGSCLLELAVNDETQLPGSDLADIVGRQITQLRQNGVVIDEPTSGAPLDIKDASDDSKVYSMPTLTFTAKNGETYLRSHYSAVVLADGKRAVVTRVCSSKAGPVEESALKQVEADATKVTVRP